MRSLVEVRLFATFRKTAGEKGFRTEAATVGALLAELASRYDAGFREQLKRATVVVNGSNAVHLKGRRTKLADGDVVSIFPPMAGG